MSITFPNESLEYRNARDRLLQKEIEERRAIEALAAERRALPPGGLLEEDYVFEGANADGATEKVTVSQLFSPGKDALIIYHFMFPRDPSDARPSSTLPSTRRLKLLEQPCPSCVALLDQLDGAVRHIGDRLNFAVVAKTSAPMLLAFGRERGWKYLRLLSCAGTTFKRDYHGEETDGAQRPMLNVFQRTGEEIRHFWSSELLFAPADPGQDPRQVGLLEPLWNLFDFTRAGRPTDWEEQLSYRK